MCSNSVLFMQIMPAGCWALFYIIGSVYKILKDDNEAGKLFRFHSKMLTRERIQKSLFVLFVSDILRDLCVYKAIFVFS